MITRLVSGGILIIVMAITATFCAAGDKEPTLSEILKPGNNGVVVQYSAIPFSEKGEYGLSNVKRSSMYQLIKVRRDYDGFTSYSFVLITPQGIFYVPEKPENYRQR